VAEVKRQTQRRRRSTHESFLRYRDFVFLKIATVACVALIAAYFFQDARPRPSGGSPLGYFLGTLGAMLIVWLALLGWRKRAVSDSYYSLKAWVSAHVYLGLSLIVIATLHTGFQFGWNVHTLAYALMLLVIASGAVGVWAYVVLPNALSENRGETTRKQMLADIASIDEMIQEAAQPFPRDTAAIVRLSLETTEIGGGFWQRLSGRYPNCPTALALRQLEPLGHAISRDQAKALGEVQGLLERKVAALALARRQIHITALLEVWLFVHVPATFALLAALTAHIASVFLYW